MNVKSLLLLLAFTGLGVSCNSDDENGPNATGGRTELQIAFSGTGESVEYDTKATASESENKIDELKIYLFVAAAQGGPYYYLETWEEGNAFVPPVAGQPLVTEFKKTETGTGYKATLYPGEVKGLPYVKLMCVANNGAPTGGTTDGLFYNENNAQSVGSVATPLVAVTVDGAGVVTNAAAATTETAFRATFTRNLGTDAATGIIATPLVMTGTGETKIAGSVSKVDIVLRRIVARFDIENNVTKSNLKIQKVTLAQGRVNGILWADYNLVVGGKRTVVAEGDLATSPLLATYQPVDFTKIPGANTGITESALYTYPNLTTDRSYLILEGTYKSPISSEQVPVTYNVPIVSTPEGGALGIPIEVKANSRYRLKITDVTQSNVYGTFEVVDWTSGGGIIVKPDNDAPVFDMANGGFETVTGAEPTPIADLKNTFVVAEGSQFKVQIAATGKVRYEKVATPTKTVSPGWLDVSAPEYKEADGVWYSIFTMTVNNATGELPVDVTFINETASYDPALWTTLTFYGPKAAPTLTDGGAGSLGNTIDYTTDPLAPIAKMYNVVGGFIKVKAMCIEGTKLVLPAEFEQKGEPVKEGYHSTFTIQVKSALTDGDTYELKFQNDQEATAQTIVTVTAVASKTTAALANVTDACADLSAGTIKTDIDLLADNSYTLNIAAPQGVTAVIPTGKWLTVTEDAFSNGITSYTVKRNAGVTDYTDFDLVFTNKLDATDQLTVKMSKAFSRPKLEAAIGQSAFNEAPVFTDGQTGTVNMYAAEGSTVKVKMTCTEAAAFATVAGLTITSEADNVYAITVDANPSFAAGSTTAVVAENSQDNTRTATLTITWKSPAITVTLTDTNTGNVVESASGDDIIYTVDVANLSNFTFTVNAKGGATTSLAVLNGTFLKAHADNTGDGTLVAGVDEVYKFRIDDDTQTGDITLTFTNTITGGGNKKIIFKKKL